MNILERGPDGATLHVHSADAVLGEHPLGNVATVQTLFSVDGRFLACVTGDHVSIYDTGTNNVVRKIPTPGTIAVHFSPTAKFLIVYQKANAVGAGEEKNLSVWNTESGEKLFSCFQKSFNKAEWPYIQFSDDDSIACRVVNNEVHFLRCCDFGAPACRLRVPNVAAAKLSPGVIPTLAAYVPEIKGQPGNVRLYNPPSDNSEGAIESPPLARRSFFRVQEVEFSWARNGVALLVLGSSEVDATNQSYYGESSLHFMRTDGELDCKVKRLHHIFFGIHLHDNERYTANTEHCGCFQQYQVPLDKEGPVHEAAWSPNSEEFVVVYGFMPAKATIYNASKCEPKYQLGAGPHNTVRWNPFGRFICLAGFGNLPGDIKFFDRKADGKYKLVGSTRAACSVSIFPVSLSETSRFLKKMQPLLHDATMFLTRDTTKRSLRNGPQMAEGY